MLEDNALVTRIVSRFHIIVTVVIALAGAAIFGAAAGEGEFFNIYVAIFGAAFVALMLALGDKYWMVIPFAFTSQLPAVPIKGRLLELPEITAVLCSMVFLLRYAVKRQTLSIFRRQHAWILLYVGWVALVFAFNPVGLSAFGEGGGALGGARFYAKILLSLAAFLIMANQQLDEKDCKWIIIILVVGSMLDSAYAISVYFLPSSLNPYVDLTVDTDSFYTWHQAIAPVPGLLICLGFARYKASELFSLNKLWAAIGFVFCVVLIALSGKRAAVAAVPIFAISAAMLRREWGYLMLWLAGAVMAASIIMVGHGELFTFPLTVQRAFSVLPAKWDSEFRHMEGGKDAFRAELRRQAIKKIEQDPWIGTGYQVNLSLSQALTAQYLTRGGDTELQVTPYAMGSAWHNTWLGYAADFGIPIDVIAAMIFLTVILRGVKLMKVFPINTFTAMLSMYILLFTIRRLVTSNTSGHTALEPFSYWWSYGVQVALFLRSRAAVPQGPAPVSWNPANPARSAPPGRGRALAGGLPANFVPARNVHQ